MMMISDSLRLPHKRMMIIIIITHHIIVTFNSPTMHLNRFISFGAARVATQRERQRHSEVLRTESRRKKQRLMPLAVEPIAHDFLIPLLASSFSAGADTLTVTGYSHRNTTDARQRFRIFICVTPGYLIRSHSTCSSFRPLARDGGCRPVATWKQLGYQSTAVESLLSMIAI